MFEAECEDPAGQHIPSRFEFLLHYCVDSFKMLLPLLHGYDFLCDLVKLNIVVCQDALLKIDEGLVGF